MVIQYCVLVFLLGLTATYAKYCGPDCCEQKGIDEPSCDGFGTSDTSDLFGTYLEGENTIAVFGKPGDIYRVWGVSIQLQRGIQTLVNLYGVYAYFFQVPKYASLNCTEFEYFILETGVCAELKKITCMTTGNVAGMDFPYKTLYDLAQFNRYKYFPCPCLAVGGTFGGCASGVDVALDTAITFSAGEITCFRNVNFGKKITYDNSDLSTIIEDQKLAVTVDPNNGIFYQTGYPYGDKYTCKDPYPEYAGGYGLTELGYDFNKYVKRRGEVCFVSQLVAEFASLFPTFQFFFSIVAIFPQPYKNAIIFYALIGGDSLFPTFRGLFSAAC